MAYLGRKGASAALTSADIPDGSISAVKVAADVATQAEIDLKANLASPTLVTPTIANMANCTFPAGHILQVVQYTATSEVTSSSTSYVSAGLDKAITPSSTSSKVLITVTQVLDQSAAGRAARYALYKDGSIHVDFFGYSHAGDSRIITHNSMMYLDSPATTSSVEYGLYFKTFGSGAHIARYSGHLGTITLMEVSG